ncbi:MAG: NUDIX hydrolase [Peptoniphilaceae bacterium]|nr:NUDIX hydrolase [Peptoniphilaceae bacterium]MDY6086024.1 NUDIX hydrolase [Peptoniphilaceae bacterium]
MTQEQEAIERTIKSEDIYEGRIVRLRVETVELPNRAYAKREIVDHAKGVGIIAVHDGDQMYMVRQYRCAVKERLLEIPAGLVEPGENPQEAAMRELEEEVGQKATKMTYLLDSYASPGFTNEKLSLFIAEGLTPSEQHLDDTEFLDVESHSIEELYRMVMNFEVVDAKSIIAILFAYQHRDEFRSGKLCFKE